MPALDPADRFAFGENWARFLEELDPERVQVAQTSLRSMLGRENLKGESFLDAGSGSGIFSLAAHRLGASVRSFDFDERSVACTRELRTRFGEEEPMWEVSQGSLLDPAFMGSLGSFDIVYSWGVVHHTGAMWVALANLIPRVGPGGRLFVAIYNDQGWKSHAWWLVKATYNILPTWLRPVFAHGIGTGFDLAGGARALIRGRFDRYVADLRGYRSRRGMSRMHDRIDWIGGLPYEFAHFEVVEAYMATRGFTLERGVRGISVGCHEFVFRRSGAVPGSSGDQRDQD